MKALLTTKETAQRLGVRIKLLENHRSEMRGLPYVAIGKSIRYMPDDVSHAQSFGLKVNGADQRAGAVAGVRQRHRLRCRLRYQQRQKAKRFSPKGGDDGRKKHQ